MLLICFADFGGGGCLNTSDPFLMTSGMCGAQDRCPFPGHVIHWRALLAMPSEMERGKGCIKALASTLSTEWFLNTRTFIHSELQPWLEITPGCSVASIRAHHCSHLQSQGWEGQHVSCKGFYMSEWLGPSQPATPRYCWIQLPLHPAGRSGEGFLFAAFKQAQMAKPDACSFVPVGIAEVALGQLTVIAAWLLISPGWHM